MEEQKFTIRPLSPDLCGDWLRYFEETAFQGHEDWSFCYCLEGHLDYETQMKWTNPDERREKAVEMIRTGQMQGYLAYKGDEVVGWCNANDRENYRYVTEMFREVGYQGKEAPDEKVKAIFCFLIAPEYRKMGVAGQLLERVCQDAARDGYTFVEVYPFGDESFEFQYHGTLGMYRRNGFEKMADLGYVRVLQKRLK